MFSQARGSCHKAVWLSHRRRWCDLGRKVCGAGTLATFWTVLWEPQHFHEQKPQQLIYCSD